MRVDTKKLANFLVMSKKRCYASGREPTVDKDRSKVFRYQNGPWLYIDRYHGYNPFSGVEYVFVRSSPVWGNHYYGRILKMQEKSEIIYEVLRKALFRVTPDMPLRGPPVYSFNNYEYRNKVSGDISEFNGHEKILHKGTEVYILDYFGGEIIGKINQL